MRVINISLVVFVMITVSVLFSCQQNGTTTTASNETTTRTVAGPLPAGAVKPSPFILTATIQDIMASIVDPSADYLWESVSIISTAEGIEEHQPRTVSEWMEVRHRAITLIEATNLLSMEGRRVVEEGKHLEDEGLEGNLTSAEIQELIDDDPASFVAFAHALNAATLQALKAIDEKDVDAFFDAGGAIDMACEACHQKYWYPNQLIPAYP